MNQLFSTFICLLADIFIWISVCLVIPGQCFIHNFFLCLSIICILRCVLFSVMIRCWRAFYIFGVFLIHPCIICWMVIRILIVSFIYGSPIFLHFICIQGWFRIYRYFVFYGFICVFWRPSVFRYFLSLRLISTFDGFLGYRGHFFVSLICWCFICRCLIYWRFTWCLLVCRCLISRCFVCWRLVHRCLIYRGFIYSFFIRVFVEWFTYPRFFYRILVRVARWFPIHLFIPLRTFFLRRGIYIYTSRWGFSGICLFHSFISFISFAFMWIRIQRAILLRFRFLDCVFGWFIGCRIFPFIRRAFRCSFLFFFRLFRAILSGVLNGLLFFIGHGLWLFFNNVLPIGSILCCLYLIWSGERLWSPIIKQRFWICRFFDFVRAVMSVFYDCGYNPDIQFVHRVISQKAVKRRYNIVRCRIIGSPDSIIYRKASFVSCYDCPIVIDYVSTKAFVRSHNWGYANKFVSDGHGIVIYSLVIDLLFRVCIFKLLLFPYLGKWFPFSFFIFR